MQSKPMMSGPRPRILTRSRSLALPLGDLDLSLTPDCPSSAGQEELRTKGEPRADPRKPMRRQKSVAELFGVVIYKSKVQLQELFSRRDKDLPRIGKKDASPVRVGNHQVEARGATGEGGGGGEGGVTDLELLPSTAELGGAVGLSPSKGSADAGPGIDSSHPTEQLTPITPISLHYSRPDLNSSSESVGVTGTRTRTPEELFCVTQDSGSMERPVSTRSLDTIHGARLRQFPDSGIIASPAANADGLLKPDKGCKTKTALVKCNSDSICRLPVPLAGRDGAVLLTKASSDDACFVRRQQQQRSGGAQLVPRDSAISFDGWQSKSGDSSPRTTTTTTTTTTSNRSAAERTSCVSSIVDWLLVGSVEAAYNEPLLCALRVEAVVDITNVAPHRVPTDKKTTCPCTCKRKHFRSKLNLAVDDIEWENIEQHFRDVNAFVDGWRRRGKRVLVVSYHGRSRAPAVAVQHLMTYYRIPLERALAHVRSRRLQTRINPGFLKALQRLEKRLAEEDSVGSPPSPPLSPLPDLAPRKPRTAWDEC